MNVVSSHSLVKLARTHPVVEPLDDGTLPFDRVDAAVPEPIEVLLGLDGGGLSSRRTVSDDAVEPQAAVGVVTGSGQDRRCLVVVDILPALKDEDSSITRLCR